ncbi:hypothetical protein FA13DRAFT_1723843 [Coprinellus micaceus]|uniref:ARM repeat-containing protein n=1 Tax=Coprinellus micaceus TaxID=71717 RepID=A0A4Y7U0N3_COPMI|nr:hypothetical protein FA13DRAFT_1723843 [Coprinellus micaceus]
MALEDRDYDVRSETIEFLTVFFNKGEGVLSHESIAAMEETNLSLFDKGIKDGYSSPRKSWLKFVAPYIKEACSHRVTLIFDLAISDSNNLVRIEASNTLYRLLNDSKVFGKRPGLLRTKTGCIDYFLGPLGTIDTSPETHFLAYSFVACDTLMKLNGASSLAHDAWVRLVVFLGRNGFEMVSDIIAAGLKASKAGQMFKDLTATFNNLEARVLEKLRGALPVYLDSALSNPGSDDILESVNLLTSLLRDENAYSLLGGPKDTHPRLMSRLAEASVKSDEDRLRKSVLNLLRALLTNGRFRESIGSRCSELMGPYLSGQEAHKHQGKIIGILYRLTANVADSTTAVSQEPSDRYTSLNDIISPHISLLLKLTLLVGDWTRQVEVRKHAEGILLENLTTYPGRSILIEDVLSEIPSVIPAIPAEGKANAVKIIDTLPVPEGKALSIAHALVPLLRDQSTYARATALELLSRLDRRYRPELTGSATQEIIALALKESVDEIRITAIQLLSAMTVPLEVPDGKFKKPPVATPTIQLASQFIPLLHNETLRPSVVELLSAMALQPSVRRALSLKIMASSFGPDGALLEAYTELLARLVSDGRFLSDRSDEATDKVMLFFASAVAAKPELEQYRFEILTALWCRYSSAVPLPTAPASTTLKALGSPTVPTSSTEDKALILEPADKSTERLVEWFAFATFGSHATQYEVDKCLSRSSLWLPKLTSKTLQSEVPAPPGS